MRKPWDIGGKSRDLHISQCSIVFDRDYHGMTEWRLPPGNLHIEKHRSQFETHYFYDHFQQLCNKLLEGNMETNYIYYGVILHRDYWDDKTLVYTFNDRAIVHIHNMIYMIIEP